jgi:DNA repair photolyase
MSAGFPIFQTQARSILSPTTGFIAAAGFTHSLTPARNCTFGCTYCYVPTLRIYGGLKPEDWKRWGQFTTVKANAAALLARQLRPAQRIYCSPLVDPYQPAEADAKLMPAILDALCANPPAVFVVQTRGPLIVRDIDALRALARRTRLRVSFSLTTDREDVRKLFEPRCAPLQERLDAMAALRDAGIEVYAALAPLLPCDPEALTQIALEKTSLPIVADPLHIRATKACGATTREQGVRVAVLHGFSRWLESEFQTECTAAMRRQAENAGRSFATGPEGFSCLAQL